MAERRVTNRDYFPTLVAMANVENEITTEMSKGKPLDQFLARRFSLSKPTVNTLLATWEKDGRIKMEKDVFSRTIRKIRILNLFFRQIENAKILVLLDLANLILNMKIPAPEELSLTSGLDNVLKRIAQEVGEIVNVFIFAPSHLTSVETETFYNEGFYTINCPRIKTKEKVDEDPSVKREKDTTDEILINFANDMIARMPDITHICLGSGDRDFCQMLRKALRKRLKIMIIAGDLTSLSNDLIDLADINPFTGKKMVYILSQSK